MVSYLDKIVCFIDILGFKSMVEVEYIDDPEKVYLILRKIDAAIRNWANAAVASHIDLQITQFSDAIVFSFLPTGHYFMTLHFFKELCITMIKEGVIFRGGMTYGKIYHDAEIIFGPAMNEAYRLESEEAKFPRIIIDQRALAVKNTDGKMITEYPGQFIFKIEAEGYAHIDYITDVLSYENQHTYYKKLREMISAGLASDIPGIRAKYDWMRTKYNLAKGNFDDLIPL